MTYRPTRIISGGQTGADMGALKAGRDLGIRTGGWAPKGWVTELGPNPELNQYGLIQHSSPNYPPRTRMNCQDSDLTAIFGDLKSAGTRLTIDICKGDDIPYILNPDAQELRDMCESSGVETLNVAGNRASKDAGIEERVRKVIVEAFGTIKCVWEYCQAGNTILVTAPRIDGERGDYNKPRYYHPGCYRAMMLREGPPCD